MIEVGDLVRVVKKPLATVAKIGDLARVEFVPTTGRPWTVLLSGENAHEPALFSADEVIVAAQG